MGKLGTKEQANRRIRKVVGGLAEVKAAGVAAGYDHTAVCTKDGKLFVFGSRRTGLSPISKGQSTMPQLVTSLEEQHVVGVAAGCCVTAAWTNDGRLYSLGHGRDGMLGHGNQEVQNLPRLVEALVGKKVLGATLGRAHTAVWPDEGELCTCGSNSLGQLGHPRVLASACTRKRVEALVGKRAMGVAARDSHTAVWTDEGELCTFECGNMRGLGHGLGELGPQLVEGLSGKEVLAWAQQQGMPHNGMDRGG